MNITPIPITEATPPQFPCWLWDVCAKCWVRYNEKYWQENPPTVKLLKVHKLTHWLPDTATAPTVVPGEEVPGSGMFSGDAQFDPPSIHPSVYGGKEHVVLRSGHNDSKEEIEVLRNK